jgi:spore cortex formation protein SpoVR/YcgB (stage V sporulation)
MRNKMLESLYKHAEGHIAKHKMNIEIYLMNPVGIGEHSDIIDAIELELEKIAKYEDQIGLLQKYFPMDVNLKVL